MKSISKYFLTIVALLISFAGKAQEVEMADTMRSNGKIYVVVGIIMIVLIGLIAYLFSMDRKLDRIEKEITVNKPNKD